MIQNPLENIQRRPARERRVFPDPYYDETALKPANLEADRVLRDAAVQVYVARTIDSIEIRTIEKPEGVTALEVLRALPEDVVVRHHPLAGIEQALSAAGAGGALLAGAPEEVAVGAMRMVLRQRGLDFSEAILETRASITDLAVGHLTTLITATSNGQMVQPTTLAHYLTGQLGPLVRTSQRLQQSYARLNRSPIGAASGMSTAVPMRRERVAGLLGFDGLIDHTFDAIASADIEQELLAIVSAAAIETTRLVVDLTEWARDDVGTIAPGDEFVHHGSAQPQRRDPQALDHLRVRLARHASAAHGLTTILLGRSMLGSTATRFETFFRVEQEFAETIETYQLLSRVLGTLVVNRALTANRAHRGFATSSELADLLAVDCGLPRDQAYALAERIATEAMVLGLTGMTMDTKLVDKLALEVVGREVGIEPETLGKCLAVKRFVERREVVGGPAPAAVRDTIERESLSARRERSWITERRDAISEAERVLREHVHSQVTGGT
ncbi:argininosuccinate lyase [soil metagenome]